MRSHLVTPLSSISSLARLNSICPAVPFTQASLSTSAPLACRSLGTYSTSTTSNSPSTHRSFSTGTPRHKLVKPQERTATNDHNINISTPSTPTVAMATSIIDLIKGRRSYYQLSKDLAGVSKDRIQDIVKDALKEVPSSFNSQTTRVVVLFGDEHDKLWDFTTTILKAIVPADAWESSAARMAMFKAAAGTILFFEDQKVIDTFQEKYALYADKFPIWATQSDAMLQFTLWTALEAEGLGANLQHYNPLIDQKVAETWGVPADWKLNAQLVFGAKAGGAGPKDYQPIEERFKVFGA
ncbi:Nitroreductase [Xylariomycetidae sp. FL2044]|nr:Nitroreductase [Xylariomycetidae sp. FL2044]